MKYLFIILFFIILCSLCLTFPYTKATPITPITQSPWLAYTNVTFKIVINKAEEKAFKVKYLIKDEDLPIALFVSINRDGITTVTTRREALKEDDGILLQILLTRE